MLAPRAEVSRARSANDLAGLTALSTHVDAKGLSGALANLERPPDPERERPPGRIIPRAQSKFTEASHPYHEPGLSQGALSVYDGRVLAGTVIPGSNNQWTAVTADGRSLGLHTSWRAAADAVWRGRGRR